MVAWYGGERSQYGVVDWFVHCMYDCILKVPVTLKRRAMSSKYCTIL